MEVNGKVLNQQWDIKEWFINYFKSMQSIEKGEQALEFESILKRVPLGQAQISLEEIKEAVFLLLLFRQ